MKQSVQDKYLEHIDFENEAKILDVGCVTDWDGNVSDLTESLLANEKFSVTGVDLRSCSRKKESFKFMKNDILNVSFKKETFDYIICSNVLQLIGMTFKRLEAKVINKNGDKLFLEKAFGWIKPEGRILINTTVSEVSQKLDFTSKISWRVYTAEELHEMLTKERFRVIGGMACDGATDTKTVIPEATGYFIAGEKEVKKPKRKIIKKDEDDAEIIDEE